MFAYFDDGVGGGEDSYDEDIDDGVDFDFLTCFCRSALRCLLMHGVPIATLTLAR